MSNGLGATALQNHGGVQDELPHFPPVRNCIVTALSFVTADTEV
jgi:hypothetical protein